METLILHIDECPNWREAGERVTEALTLVGASGGEVDYRLVTETSVRDLPQFAGSPTILVDGHDLFPSEGATADVACRVYVSEGRLAGLPSVGEIAAALRQREVHVAQD
ncbi:thioredoxin family protein [Chryseoglobus sp. 28M-23]|uniref:thioredoxin family protein n=1 Tax=Chryseoglobus sp. 28M-23 TaxID=2772253 RepID=UPI001746C974|nr:thioredoxin family protein [Chryseoglobus sp. 28M-23]MBU1251537.1 thioredoxin family protein [Actinomycetota bacterium]MBU1608418.1 thioredoxin family protein [Actinomycetota bacterium]MBU2316460.1 thioredoxin family protein [Actinomycetota bacterium]MBU2385406.1 thioredoxin family protein [Actinomycetota bacterium]QOD92955.1 thioredoxin family protein [Chryseoglobus sp. 28M-23]